MQKLKTDEGEIEKQLAVVLLTKAHRLNIAGWTPKGPRPALGGVLSCIIAFQWSPSQHLDDGNVII